MRGGSGGTSPLASPHGAQVLGSLMLQDGKAGVVVRELRQVRERDTPDHDGIVAGHVGLRVPRPVLLSPREGPALTAGDAPGAAVGGADDTPS